MLAIGIRHDPRDVFEHFTGMILHWRMGSNKPGIHYATVDVMPDRVQAVLDSHDDMVGY